jgi:hypothetical protein
MYLGGQRKGLRIFSWKNSFWMTCDPERRSFGGTSEGRGAGGRLKEEGGPSLGRGGGRDERGWGRRRRREGVG